MNETAGIVSRNWGFCRTLRDDGVSYCDYHDYILPKTMGGMAQIEFADDRDGCLFTEKIHRKPTEELEW